MKRLLPILAIAALAGCMKEPVHQGNVLKEGDISQIQVGDSKFHVESVLGFPILKSALHPNRVDYVEEYDDKKSGKWLTRGVEITYDDALRVTDVHRFGDWR